MSLPEGKFLFNSISHSKHRLSLLATLIICAAYNATYWVEQQTIQITQQSELNLITIPSHYILTCYLRSSGIYKINIKKKIYYKHVENIDITRKRKKERKKEV